MLVAFPLGRSGWALQPRIIIIAMLKPIIFWPAVIKIHIADAFEVLDPVFHGNDETKRVSFFDREGLAI